MTNEEPAPFTAGWTLDDEAATATVAASTRALITSLRRANAPTSSLERAAALIDEAAALVEPHRVDGLPMQGRLGDQGPIGAQANEPRVFFPWSPIIGPLNPLSADVDLNVVDGRTTGRAFLGESWVDRVEGRKVFTLGTISIDGEVTARAEGIFIMTQGWKAENK